MREFLLLLLFALLIVCINFGIKKFDKFKKDYIDVEKEEEKE
ncbi:MAG: hypothetical protein ACI4EO_05980 [Blautia sp.]